MNVLSYIQNAGKQIPTFASRTLSTVSSFLDPQTIKDNENERINHSNMISSYFNEHVYTH